MAWGKHGESLAAGNREQARLFAESLRDLIFDLMLNHRCSRTAALSRELNRRGVKTRNGGDWYPATVRRLKRYLEPSLSEDLKRARIVKNRALWRAERAE